MGRAFPYALAPIASGVVFTLDPDPLDLGLSLIPH